MNPARNNKPSKPVSEKPPAPCNDMFLLLARCVMSENAAWARLQRTYRPLARVLYRSLCKSYNTPSSIYQQADEFADWFFGWLAAYSHRVQNALTRLNEEITAGRVTTTEQQERFFKSYLGRIIGSAFVEFLKEQRGAPLDIRLLSGDISASDDVSNDGAEPPPLFDQMDQFDPNTVDSLFGRGLPDIVARDELITLVMRALELIGPDLAVPLVLKSRPLYELVDLPATHIKWIARQCGKSRREVERLIEQEYDNHPDGKYPFKSAFIATLLDISPANVDQRAHRGLIRLREALLTLAPDLLQ